MNWRVNTNPKKDGEYLLAQFMDGGEEPYDITIIGFTTEGGWNTSRSLRDGTLRTEHGFGFEPSHSWAWIPIEETGARKARERALEANRG